MPTTATMPTTMSHLFKALAVLAALAIAYASLQPTGGTQSIPHADKVLHLIAYGGLAGLIGLGWWRLPLVWAVAVAAAFGAGVEIAQGVFTAGRTPSVADALANTLGAGLAAWVLSHIRRRVPPN